MKTFYNSLKPTITRDEYEQVLNFFKENDCATMGDWLRVYNVADVVPFNEAFRKITELIKLMYAKMWLVSQVSQ